MKSHSLYRIFGTLILLLVLSSCSSNLDFDQINDVKLKPVIVTNLAYFDVKSSQFITNGREQNLIVAFSEFDAFRDSYFRDSLKKAELNFEYTNTINRAFTIELIMLTQNDVPVYSIPFNVPAYTGVDNKVIKIDVFENAKLDVFKSTVKIIFSIRMGPGPAINGGSLKLRSGATIYLELE
ncbi:hypothetical protein [Flavobacterium sp. K5-23]|uniref:hypothetical protein n=1 Tax=Flavobacterium sp. K5-23 TaxID=2746225 RepID=UPI00200ED91D|nr:hypothetical protein [Flavobacterium sp. K5-23]UQD57495.1 hypothetical protein FLAK523_14265 [Flavobacterium sp. K5-23]